MEARACKLGPRKRTTLICSPMSAYGHPRRTSTACCCTPSISCGPLNDFSEQEGHLRAALPLPLHSYQASPFKLAQCSAFRIGLYAPGIQHKIGDDERVNLPQPPNVPEGQPDQQCLYAK